MFTSLECENIPDKFLYCLGNGGVEAEEPLAVMLLEPLVQVITHRDLRYEIKDVLSLGKAFVHEFYVDLGLAASGNAFQKHGFLVQMFKDLVHSLLLGFGQGNFIQSVFNGAQDVLRLAVGGNFLLPYGKYGVGGLENLSGRTQIVSGDDVPETDFSGRDGRSFQNFRQGFYLQASAFIRQFIPGGASPDNSLQGSLSEHYAHPRACPQGFLACGNSVEHFSFPLYRQYDRRIKNKLPFHSCKIKNNLYICTPKPMVS